uniref:Uncharacterized protein n=1 Tax=Rhizophora mucronata TaxID=61149 RepID=A0A2P2Q2C6_RHIMU
MQSYYNIHKFLSQILNFSILQF